MDHYAVVGNPVSHSKSPLIHRLFAEQTDQSLTYEAILLQEDSFEEELKRFFDKGGKGVNVTLPFKERAFGFVDSSTPRANLAGAVNTIISKNGQLLGDNTDGQGLVYDLQRLVSSLKNRSILLIGAGGAAKGVIAPLFEAGVKQIHVANRTPEKALALAEQFEDLGLISGSDLLSVPTNQADIVVNSTSSSVTNEVPAISKNLFDEAQIAYDMFYSDADTSFMNFAKDANVEITTSDGLGMLVGQAAESFRLWRGVTPEIAPVIDSLKSN